MQARAGPGASVVAKKSRAVRAMSVRITCTSGIWASGAWERGSAVAQARGSNASLEPDRPRREPLSLASQASIRLSTKDIEPVRPAPSALPRAQMTRAEQNLCRRAPGGPAIATGCVLRFSYPPIRASGWRAGRQGKASPWRPPAEDRRRAIRTGPGTGGRHAGVSRVPRRWAAARPHMAKPIDGPSASH